MTVLGCLAVCGTLIFLAFVDTKVMKADTTQDLKESRKVREELKAALKELKEQK